jgi:methyltransferase (TIGR00027 family)
MLQGQPSRSLLRPAIARAAHQLLDAPLILRDPLAVDLVPECSEQAIRAALEEHRASSALRHRSLFALRSRFVEDRLAIATGAGVRQYVMLGAGLETFPWRQPEFARTLQIFFCDHPSSLAWARDRFQDRALAPPSNLTFVPLDLEALQVGRTLVQSGFSPRLPTFISMLGVTQYLTTPAVHSLLALFSTLPSGSESVFSFTVPDDELDEVEVGEIRAGATRLGGIGEPWLTRLSPADMLAQVRGFDFHEVFHLSPEIAQNQYFSGRDDGLKAPHREQIISARR